MADTKFRVGFIGVGRPRNTDGATGFGMAYIHADGYVKTGHCDLVACADIDQANGSAFAQKYGFSAVYTDYESMLTKESLDFVSICTWPHLHAPMVTAAAQAGVRAIHCEKPMAPTWREAREMAAICKERSVKLTFNHQRRYLAPFQIAHKLAHDGTIGKLERLEANCGDLYDWGTHWLDMLFFLNNETPAQWVMGQIDLRKERKIFGVAIETQGICQFQFEDGVRALLETGQANNAPAAHRLIGTDGVVEVRWDEPHLRVLNTTGGGWRNYEGLEDLHDSVSYDRTMADVVRAVIEGRECMLSAANALRETEVIFAAYESSRRRARIDLPLTIDDNPFLAMIASGEIGADIH